MKKVGLKMIIVGVVLFSFVACSGNTVRDEETVQIYKEKNQQLQPKREHSGY